MAWALLVIGLIVVLLSLLADVLGIGQVSGFGWRQGVGVIIGVLLAGLGGYWGRRPKPGR